MMSQSSHDDAGVVTLTVRGEIDLANVDEFHEDVAAAVASDATTIVVDLSEVTFIDSGGISVLLKGRRLADEQGKEYRVTGATGMVSQILDLTGVSAHLSGNSH